jgi:NAD(P)-dependent dehydrogenase (short-subunit alcohol dehydrogenase family)
MNARHVSLPKSWVLSKTAVVTGVAGAIGAATAKAFTQAGWKVIGVDARGAATAAGIEAITADVSVSADVERVAAAVGRAASRVDCLVHCAAVQIAKPLLELTDQEWELTFRTNVTAVVALTRLLAKLLDGGSIINISSVHARATSPGMAAYVASKGALSALTRAMALELADRGIRVNAILPGAIESDMMRDALKRGKNPKAARNALVQAAPLKRIGEAEDVAQLVVFLADASKAGNITGQEFVCDGGVLARLASE